MKAAAHETLEIRTISISARPRGIDRLVWSITIAVVLISPFPLGSNYPPAYSAIEAAIFGTCALWMLDGARLGYSRFAASGPRIFGLAAPGIALGLYFTMQLMPLPPAVLRIISPATYELYSHSFVDWPEAAGKPEEKPPGPERIGSRAMKVLPTSREIESGAAIPFAVKTRTEYPSCLAYHKASKWVSGWQSISVARPLTQSALLELAACASLILIVGFHPLNISRNSNETDVCASRLALVIVLIGSIVAIAALIERAAWNGKILWRFTPYDWSGAPPRGIRARGPFVNPDHLADYLDMILPLAICGLPFPAIFVSTRRRTAAQAGFAFAVAIMVSAILLSGSRGGWTAALFGAGGFGLFRATHRIDAGRRRIGGRVQMAGFLGLLGAIVLVCGVQGMRQAGERLGSALDPRGSADFRFGVWSDTTAIVKHFPIFGVGLGAYQDILPRYEQAPWTPVEIRTAHNDYMQFAAEAGLLGVALALWLGAAAVQLLANSLRTAGPAALGLPTALLCGLASLAMHEVCDFSLHTVANAIMASVIAGLLLRLRCSSSGHLGAKGGKVTIVRFASAAVFAALAIAALAQDSIPYPYNVKAPAAPRSAIEWSLAHPARAEPHMAIARLAAGASPDMAIDQLRAAAWLSPTDPYIRDSLARTLMEYGLERQAMRQIELSVAMAPSLAQHEYLRWRLIPWLPAPELNAIKAGFLAAVAQGYAGAVDNFGGFYAALGREADEARLYEAAAREATTRDSRERYLLGAGNAYADLREYSHAENDYFEARETDPMSEAPYDALIGKVYIPSGRFDAAGKLIDSAVRSGLEAYPLLCVLGSSAAATDASREAALAFARAVALRPSGFQGVAGLGRAYAAAGQYERSAYWLGRAVDARPESCQLRFELAQAEEGAYNYIGAQRDYEKASRICGNDAIVAARYESFKLKLRAARGGN